MDLVLGYLIISYDLLMDLLLVIVIRMMLLVQMNVVEATYSPDLEDCNATFGATLVIDGLLLQGSYFGAYVNGPLGAYFPWMLLHMKRKHPLHLNHANVEIMMVMVNLPLITQWCFIGFGVCEANERLLEFYVKFCTCY